MALSLLKQGKQPSPKLNEWILTIDDCRNWRSAVSKPDLKCVSSISHFSNRPWQSVQKQLQTYLSDNNLYIGPNTFSSGFILVLHEACRSDDVDTVRYILKHREGQFDINQLILHHPVKCFTSARNMTFRNRKEHRSESLMHAAVRGESTDILKILVDNGASLETPDCCGKTALLIAIEKSTYERRYSTTGSTKSFRTVLYLIQAGANVNYQDKNGSTALMYLEDSAYCLSLFRILVKAGADLQITNNCGHTAIHDAVLHEKIKLLTEMLPLQSSALYTSTSVPHPLLFQHHGLTRNHFTLDSWNTVTALFVNQTGFPSQLIVDNLFLIVTYKCFCFVEDDNWIQAELQLWFESFQEAIVKRSQLNVPLPSSEPHNVYCRLVEIQSLEDLENYSNLQSVEVRINLAYQCLIIRERCLGYGDASLIRFLFTFGKWMLAKLHNEGLLLWLRGSNMLLSQIEDCNFTVPPLYLQLVQYGIDVSYSHDYNMKQFEHPDVFSLLVNLIKCLGLCIDLHKQHHYHTMRIETIQYRQYRIIIDAILSSLHTYESRFPCSTRVEELGRLLITKCPVYLDIACNSLPTNILYTALCTPNLLIDIDFIRRLLLWGGDSLVNEIGGLLGNRPLHLCDNKPEIMELLLQHGAHLDAVNINRTSAFPSNSLQCLCAHTIITDGIPYDTLDLPKHIKQLISFHDPQDICNKIKERTNALI